MKLNVGSGTPSPWHNHRDDVDMIHVDWNRAAYPLTLVCDAHYLPFVDGVFTDTYLDHILEHLAHPLQALREARRVTREWVLVSVPNASYYKEHPSDGSGDHLYSWNQWTLHDLLARVFPAVSVAVTRRYGPMTLYRKMRYASWLAKLQAWWFHLVEQWLYGPPDLTGICRVHDAVSS